MIAVNHAPSRSWLDWLYWTPVASLKLLAVLSQVNCACAQITAERLFPPAASIDSQATIVVEGKFPSWPVKVDCSRTTVDVRPGPKPGELTVNVPAGERAGFVWLRCYDDVSASNLLPLLLVADPVVIEPLADNKNHSETRLSLPTTVAGRLEKNDEVDVFPISVKAGEQLVVSLTAHEVLRSPMDAVMQLVDQEGHVLAQSDDERGLDPQLIYDCGLERELMIRVFAFPETPTSSIRFAGGPSFVYLLHVTTAAFVDHHLPILFDDSGPSRTQHAPFHAYGWNLPHPVEPQDFIEYLDLSQWSVSNIPATLQAGSIVSIIESPASEPLEIPSLPALFSGHISEPGEVDTLRLGLAANRKYRAEIFSHSLGFKLDGLLRACEAESGVELARADDRARNDYDAVLDFSVKQDTHAVIKISDVANSGSLRHAYTLHLSEVLPSVSLSVSSDRYVLKRKETLDIPIKITRLDGFSRVLSLQAINLPEGVTCEPQTSDPQGDSAKLVTLKLTASESAAAFQGNFRIIASLTGSEVNAKGEVHIQPCLYSLRPGIDLSQFWLTVPVATGSD